MNTILLVIHNNKVVKHSPFDTFGKAFESALDSYKDIFNKDLSNDIEDFMDLKEDNIFWKDLDHDNSYAFQIIEVPIP
jgi:hypothetical protein